MNLYNDNDPLCCAWIHELIKANALPQGIVLPTSICDIDPTRLLCFNQCHFFAGIGGWPYALRLSGWPDDLPVWTGSCPCQPLSCAGQRKGHADERHLWPAFYRLIAQCRPPVVFGEQVAGVDGREWLAGIRADLEGIGYAVGAADLCAAGVGAPHIRQRLYWVAHAYGQRQVGKRLLLRTEKGGRDNANTPRPASAGGDAGGVGDTECHGFTAYSERCRTSASKNQGGLFQRQGSDSAWSAFDLIPCRDGKSRRVESGTLPLAHGVPARVVRLRGYGNAICVPLAEAFIRAVMEVLNEKAL